MAEIKTLKPQVELSQEQAAFVADLRSILDRAIKGEIIGLFAVLVGESSECEPCISGGMFSDGEVYMALHNLADMVRGEDLAIALGIDEED